MDYETGIRLDRLEYKLDLIIKAFSKPEEEEKKNRGKKG